MAVEDAVLIWSVSDRNWKKNIADIKPDPSAERFVRKIDALPLRSEQLYEDVEFLEKLVDLKNEDILDWMWTPVSNFNLDSSHWSDTATSFYNRISVYSGKKTREAMRLVIDWFEVNDPIQTWKFDNSSRAAFLINGNYVHVGRPSINLRCLDHHSCSGLMLVPHFTKRGPNGIWIIRRGTNHRLEKMFREICVYFLKWKDQSIAIVQVISEWQEIHLIDLFRKKADADLFAWEISEEKEPEYYSSEVSGNELLRIISLVDQVEIDGEAYAISPDGTWLDDEEFARPEAAELKNILTRTTESKPNE